MAITHANLETDLRYAAALDTGLEVLLTDMASIRKTGAVTFYGTVNGTGSDTNRIRQINLGGATHMAAAGTEISDEAASDPTNAGVNIAVTRSSLVREISDLAVLTGFPTDLSPMVLANDMLLSYEGRFNDLVATAVATASTNVGASGVDMSTDDFFDAKYTLQLSSVPGPYFCLLHPRQLADLEESIRSEGGPVQYLAATAEMLRAKGQGYAGNWLGIDIFQSTDVTSAGGNREGGMWGPGAVGYKTGIVDPKSMIGSAAVVIQQGELVIEIGHVVGGGRTKIAGDVYVGVSVIEQSRLVGIVTDA
jgi:hypothetical protein